MGTHLPPIAEFGVPDALLPVLVLQPGRRMIKPAGTRGRRNPARGPGEAEAAAPAPDTEKIPAELCHAAARPEIPEFS
jgi:hypothetical protein